MNKNIEVINEHLWAVKFSYIPYIDEIEYKADPDTPAYTETVRLANNGLLLLNKDCKYFDTIRKIFTKIMKLCDKQLKFEMEHFKENTTNYQVIYSNALFCEAERRTKERMANNGNNTNSGSNY